MHDKTKASRQWLAATLIALLSSLSACHGPRSTQTSEFFAFGTIIAITTEELAPNRLHDLNQAVQHELTSMHQRWHAWHPSQLQRIHEACRSGTTLSMDADIIELIKLGQHYEQASHGYFNPAAGELIKLWGFFSSSPNLPRQPPSHEAISKVLANQPSLIAISISGRELSCHNPDLLLDFGAFAKGYGMAKLASMLKGFGVQHALINIGGDILTIGSKPDGQPWSIALTNPITGELIGNIKSTGTSQENSVFTSGLAQRRFTYQGQTYHHLLNPKTGYPAIGLASVTVITGDPTLADAAATAIFVAGDKEWLQIAKALNIEQVVVVDLAGKVTRHGW